MVDQSFTAEHVDCLECKSLNQPIADFSSPLILVSVVYTSDETAGFVLEAAKQRLVHSDPARAPPLTT